MKVILNTDSVKFPLTGIGRYVYELGAHLQAFEGLDELILWSGLKAQFRLPELKSIINHPFSIKRLVIEALKRNYLTTAFGMDIYQRANTLALRKCNEYIYHGPNFFLPEFPGPSVVTFHDVSIFKYPSCHPANRVRLMDRVMAKSLERANLIITISEFSRQEIARFYSWPLEKIKVTYLAAANNFRPYKKEEILPFLKKYNLTPYSYTLFTGTYEPRKNINILLDAYELLPKKIRLQFPLVLSGFSGWSSKELHRRLERAEREGWVRSLGFVSDMDIPALMAGAIVFLFPSLYEGFGLPPLEAMACGVPVLASNCSSLPEILGDAALLLDPLDKYAWHEAIMIAIEDREWKEKKGCESLVQAKKYTWNRCVHQTVEAYKEVV